jgi:prolyl-tRNA synthetase
MRTADESVLNETLGVQAGSVNPFCLVNDQKKEVKYLLDKSLYSAKYLALHPMVNSSSVFIETEQFLAFLKKNNIEPVQIDFTQEVKKEEPKENKKEEKKNQKPTKDDKKKKEDDEIKNTLGIEVKKEDDFSMWYQQVITKAEMVEYYDISGCYILRPWSYSIWENIQRFFDDRIKTIGVENTYFPLFVTDKQLSKEESHIKGFKPEVAWVTKSGDTPLANPIAIRPTSETIMYPSFSKWIRSHRDLPLKINQWTNIVRWEFKNPTPFLRTREFLWQEGHTAHATFEDSNKMVFDILEFYRQVYEELLALPVIKGIKTESEKFAGALFTSTVESAIPANGKGIQCATSHHLGQNFSKMFDIKFSDLKDENQFAWQTSWGLSTRSIGIVIMTHSDNNGLVLPPRIAPIQVVFVPIIYKDDDSKEIISNIDNAYNALRSAGVKCKVDDRDNYNPGWKFFHWELKGVPIRIEFGKKDLKNGVMTLVCRDNGEKLTVKIEDIKDYTVKLLDTIQRRMFEKAQAGLNNMKKEAHDFKSFYESLCNKNILLTNHCGASHCEENVLEKVKSEAKKLMEESGKDDDKDKFAASAKTLCMPLDEQKNLKEGDKCFFCGAEAKKRILWGKSY